TRLYKTGDLVKQRRDGVIDYLGRIDHQVKVRGYRIELGEIEARLLQQPNINLSVVVAKTIQNEQQLVAYVSSKEKVEDKTKAAKEIRTALQAQLPSYMVPAIVMVLDEMPLLNNGKIDRKQLPEAQYEQVEYVAPTTETEKALALIWQDVLFGTSEKAHVKREIGIHDNFFELGGHSLLATKVASRINNAFA